MTANGEEQAPVEFPLKDFLGFTIEKGDRQASAELQIGAQHMNPNGVVHGAVPFALMDTAMGAAVMSVIPEGSFCATIEVHTRFHAGASTGGLRAEATVTSAGKRIVHLEARTYDVTDRLVASATGSFAVIEPRVRS